MSRRRPNIVLIVSDEHNPQMTGCYGHKVVRTPHLDRLAAEGVTFERAYCNSPTCVCSRASMMTGRYVHEIGVFNHSNPLRSDIPTFANYLEAAGYETTLCGKMHFVGDWNQLHGFGYRLMGEPEQWTEGWDKPKVRSEATRRGTNSHVSDSGPGRPFFPVGFDMQVTELAERFLRAKVDQPSARPWLLVVGTIAPHFPLYAPKEYFDMYYPDNVEMPRVGYDPGQAEHPVIHQIRRWLRQEEGISDEVTRRSLAAYYGLVSFTDANVGRLIDVIDQSHLREDTIVIYTSDHGEMAGHLGLWQKFCFYEPSVRVPLIVRLPGGPKGRRLDEYVSLVDIAPTLCDVAQTLDPGNFSGVSLLPLINGQSSPGAGDDNGRIAFSEYHAHGIIGSAYMVAKGGLKYIYYPGYQPQLFDLSKDPDEIVNCAGDPAYDRHLEALHADLLSVIDDPDGLERQVKELEKLPGLQAVKRFAYSPRN